MKSGTESSRSSCVGDLEMHRHDVCAEPEEHALPEGQHAAAPPGEPDSDGDDREAQELAEQAQPEVGQERRRDAEQHERGERESGCGADRSGLCQGPGENVTDIRPGSSS